MTGQQAAEIIRYALVTLRHAQVREFTAAGDTLDITFTDGTVAHVAITVTPAPDGDQQRPRGGGGGGRLRRERALDDAYGRRISPTRDAELRERAS